MIDLKKINQLRNFSEGISVKPRATSRISIGAGGADHSVEKDTLGNVPYTPKTEKDKRIKAALDKMGQQFKEAKDPREYDYEGDMAKSQLRSIISNAQEIHDMLEDNTNIAEWVQSKITLSADYITTVRDYMNSEVNEGSVGYHTKIAQTAKGLSTKHKHSALAMKAKAKFKPSAIGTNMVIPANEQAELDEAVSKAKDLKTLLTRHSELAIAANKDGDHEAVKYHQAKMNAVKNQMAKLAKEEVEPIHEISKELAKSYLDKTVDPVYGMPKHGMKDRMKGIRQASIRVLKKAGKPKTN